MAFKKTGSIDPPEDKTGSTGSDKRSIAYSAITPTPTPTKDLESDELESPRDGKKDDDEEMDELDMDEELTEDIYSLIYIANVTSPAFFFAIFVFLFQMAVIMLTLRNLTEFSNSDNPFKIPPGVDPEVTAAQAFALILGAATQMEDLHVALNMLEQGYDKSVKYTNPSATWWKWLFSSMGQLFAGCTLLAASFLLVVQSSEVIDMFFNFAALSFISEIDDAAFALAKRGYISKSIQKVCVKDVCEHQESVRMSEHRPPIRKKSQLLRPFVFLFVCAVLMTGYGVIVSQQKSGKFLSQTLFVQFGDSFVPNLPTLSGVYKQNEDEHELRDGRVFYVAKHAILGYCKEEKAWTFTETGVNWTETSACEDTWTAKSPETESYDITTTSKSSWLVLNPESKKGVPLESFTLASNDCKSTDGERGLCSSNHGECRDNKCECNKGFFGLNCEFTGLNEQNPCATLHVDDRKSSFPDLPEEGSYRGFSDEYQLLRDGNEMVVELYNRPVYVFEHDNGEFDILMFLGRRWVISDTGSFKSQKNTWTESELAAYLSGEFDGYNSSYESYFISDPMDVNTPSDALTPVGLEWYRVKSNNVESAGNNEIDPSQPLNTALLCSVCLVDVNDCFNLGTCGEEAEAGQCTCPLGFVGTLCEHEVPCTDDTSGGCLNDGECDADTGTCDCGDNFGGDQCQFDESA